VWSQALYLFLTYNVFILCLWPLNLWLWKLVYWLSCDQTVHQIYRKSTSDSYSDSNITNFGAVCHLVFDCFTLHSTNIIKVPNYLNSIHETKQQRIVYSSRWPIQLAIRNIVVTTRTLTVTIAHSTQQDTEVCWTKVQCQEVTVLWNKHTVLKHCTLDSTRLCVHPMTRSHRSLKQTHSIKTLYSWLYTTLCTSNDKKSPFSETNTQYYNTVLLTLHDSVYIQCQEVTVLWNKHTVLQHCTLDSTWLCVHPMSRSHRSLKQTHSITTPSCLTANKLV